MAELGFTTERMLSLLLWNTCNAKCAHCSPESGPKDKTSLTHERIIELIEEASSIYGKDWCLSLSGGEVFLFYDRLLEYVELAKKLNGYTTLITNCFWADTYENAIRKLKPLIAADLRILGVSADLYHTPYISLDKVINAAKAAKDLGIRVHLRMASTKSNRLKDLLVELGDDSPFWVEFMEMPLIPDGRAALLPREDLIFEDKVPESPCPAASITINPSGKAMVCCSGAGKFKPLQVGDVYKNSITEIEYNFNSNPLLLYLRSKGPKYLLDYLPEEEKSAFLNDNYVNVCHLCINIFKDEKRGEFLKTKIEEKFVAEMFQALQTT